MSQTRRDSSHSSSSSQHSLNNAAVHTRTAQPSQNASDFDRFTLLYTGEPQHKNQYQNGPSVNNVTGYSREQGNDVLSYIWAGPDGARNHHLKRLHAEYTGIGEQSSEKTSNLGYMFRTPTNYPFPRGKQGRLGEIGGAVQLLNITRNDGNTWHLCVSCHTPIKLFSIKDLFAATFLTFKNEFIPTSIAKCSAIYVNVQNHKLEITDL